MVIGNAKGKAPGAGVEVGVDGGTNYLVFAVNRDIDEMDAKNGDILFTADRIKFPGTGYIWFGDQTLQSILAGAGQGEVNTIQTIKVNGSALTPDGDRAVDITIPSAGDANVIESITVNGTALVPDANKAVAITIPDAGQNNVIEKITTNGVEATVGENKTVNIVIPVPGDANVIETVKVNGTALTPNNKEVDIIIPTIDGKLDATNGIAYSDLKVYPMPSGIVGQSHTIITHESISIGDAVEYKENEITHNGESYEFGSDTNGIARLKDVTTAVGNLTITTAKVTDLDSYKNPTISAAAAQAITDINNANDIATIKSTLTNFLQQFVIQNP